MSTSVGLVDQAMGTLLMLLVSGASQMRADLLEWQPLLGPA